MALISTGLNDDVARYVDGMVAVLPAVLTELAEHIERTGMEQAQISPAQGTLLAVLIRACEAKRILEIGTYLGYSAIWMAMAAGSGGHIDSFEIDEERATQARTWLAKAGVADSVHVHHVPAGAVTAIRALPDACYDLAFIDANKVDYPVYLDEAVRLVRTRGLIIADNTLHKGRVTEPSPTRETTRGIKIYNETARDHPRLQTVLIPLGDGLTVSLRT